VKTWLFAIAQNIARDHLRSLKRWPENVGDICKDAAMGDQEFFREAMTIRQDLASRCSLRSASTSLSASPV
jgi:DNA-directed RNA polymerase specialized sigma24 family protein